MCWSLKMFQLDHKRTTPLLVTSHKRERVIPACRTRNSIIRCWDCTDVSESCKNMNWQSVWHVNYQDLDIKRILCILRYSLYWITLKWWSCKYIVIVNVIFLWELLSWPISLTTFFSLRNFSIITCFYSALLFTWLKPKSIFTLRFLSHCNISAKMRACNCPLLFLCISCLMLCILFL